MTANEYLNDFMFYISKDNPIGILEGSQKLIDGYENTISIMKKMANLRLR
jgi:hypothetical protein